MDYPKDQREVFLYFDGAGQRAGDPLEILYRIGNFFPNQAAVLKMCQAGEDDQENIAALAAMAAASGQQTDGQPTEQQRSALAAQAAAERFEGHRQLVEAVRQIFEMAPYDRVAGTGATWQHCIRVWNDYQDYLEKKSEQPGSSPTSPAATAPA